MAKARLVRVHSLAHLTGATVPGVEPVDQDVTPEEATRLTGVHPPAFSLDPPPVAAGAQQPETPADEAGVDDSEVPA